MLGGVHMAFCKSSRCLTLPTWCWNMGCRLSHVLTPTKSLTGWPLHSSRHFSVLLSSTFSVCPEGVMDFSLVCYSTLGRIIKVSPGVLAYREWTIKKWGAKQYARLEKHGSLSFAPIFCSIYLLFCDFFACAAALNWADILLVIDIETCEQDLARLMLVSVEDQRDTSSPLSADSPSPSPVFLPSPQHHSSSSSACSLSSSGSDIVRLFPPHPDLS